MKTTLFRVSLPGLFFLLSSQILLCQTFTEQTTISLQGIYDGSVMWGDYDNDGDPDILLIGNGYSLIYRNDAGIFVNINAGLPGITSGSAAWGDYDNDGDLDVLLTGGGISKIYRNDAGVFTDINAGLTGVDNGSVAWGDYDNDGDLDILLTGNANNNYFSKIYRNDNGVFNDISAVLTGVYASSVTWGDYDNDGDLDILLTGNSQFDGPVTKLYRNDNGIFTDINAGLVNAYNGSVAWGDYDNDGDLDILLTGYNWNDGYISKIYRNSSGTFTDIGAGLIGVGDKSSVAWGDYDNDGDLDILLTGYNNSLGTVSKIYNNNAGVFSDISAGLTGVSHCSVAWGDYDKDNDLDILLTGNGISKIYKNNASSANTVPASPSGLLSGITAGVVTLSWNKSTDAQTTQNGLSYNLYIGTAAGTVNKCSPMAVVPGGYRKIARRGNIESSSWTVKKLPAATYYWSVQAIDHCFAGSAFATEGTFTVPFSNSIAPAADQKLIINQTCATLTVTESSTPTSRQWKYSTVNGGPYNQSVTGATGTTLSTSFSANGNYYVVCESTFGGTAYTSNQVKIVVSNYIEQTGISLTGVYNSSVTWGDYDNDGDLDILLTGYSQSGRISKIYRNDGSNTFTEQTGILLTPVDYGSSAWGDYDNDGYIDILLTGGSDSGPVSKIYHNNGNNTFTEQTGISLTGVSSGSVAWGDYDNDGDLDILLTGNSVSGTISKIYRNDAGVFTDINAGLTAARMSSVAWGDYDNDGDLDILLSGYNDATYGFSTIYRNDNGVFTDINAGLYANPNSSVAWGDYDNDGDLDILLAIYDVLKIYRNDAGTFTDINAGFASIKNGSVAWGDYDNDGDLDFIISGSTSTSLITKIFQNNNGSFTEIFTGLEGVSNGSVAWGDYDNDGDLDILLTGISNNGPVSKIYKKNNAILNTVPTAPSNLGVSVAGTGVSLSWNKATDTQTLQNGLSYNLYIGTAAGTVSKKPAMAALPGGYRRVVQKGLIQSNTWLVKRLPAGTYYWSVQAIDNTFAGSAFATEGSFTVPFSNSVNPGAEQILAINQNGLPLTVTESVPPASRQWKYSSTSGGPYSQSVTGATGVTYTPNFPAFGTYFVVCEAVYNSVAYTSNEVKISVPAFTEQTGISLTGVQRSSVAWGDYDNDGDQDILLTGYNNIEGYISKIYNNNAGVFTDISAGLTGVQSSSVAWGDYDNDGDLDILLTGWSNSGEISKIYNNNAGVFTDISAGLTGVEEGSVAWGDYDNDGDLDILLTGYTGSGDISKIYRNDAGVFTDINAGLMICSRSSAAWGDYDNDGDLDILITGNGYSKVYRNDNGVFTDINAGLSGVYSSSAAWGDYDNDGDLDILLTGDSSSKIYRNDNGIFTDISAGLTVVYNSSVAWGDYDNDGDLDILLTGTSSSGTISKIYRNDAGVFTDINAGLSSLTYGSAAWGDYDKDGDLDILLTGAGSSGYIAKIYKSNSATANTVPSAPSSLLATVSGTGVTFTWNKAIDTQTTQNGLSYNLYVGTAAGTVNKRSPMAALPGGYRRIVQKGLIQTNSWLVKRLTAGTYYWSVQAIDNCLAGSAFASEVSFTVPFSNSISPIAEQTLAINQNGNPLTVTESSIPASRQWKYSTLRGGPYDQTISGATGTSCTPGFSAWGTYYVVCESVYNTVTYTSNEVKINVVVFSEQTGISLTGVQNSSVAWGDYDNDGDMDILLTGYSSGSGYISKIYNNNAGVFTDIAAGLTGVYYSSVAWGDYDNDGDLDILLTGNTGSVNISKIYNNNAGVFTDIGAGLTGVQEGSVAWGDYDNDGDLDILITGYTGAGSISKIYRNDAGIFTDINAGLIGVYYSSVAWGDYDNDGDLDILLTGNGYSKIYRNDNGVFTDINAGLTGVYQSSVAWGDYDNDGDLDILLTGTCSKIYRNDNGIFTDINAGIIPVYNGSVAWGDYDNDGDLDILLTGNPNIGPAFSKIYRNDAGVFTDINAGLTGVYQGSVAWGDYDKDGDLDILLTGIFVSKIYKNNISSSNTAPTAPSGLVATVTGNVTTLTWNKATDTQTLQNGLSYNLYIGSSAGTINKRSPMAALPGGYRRVAQIGQIQNNTWSVKKLTSGTYYWSVQAIDNSFAGSAFATEGSFNVPFSNSVAPVSDQILLMNQNGTLLTVTELPAASSRQWKYSSVSGGPYNQSITGATGTTYIPNFSTFGNYYVICESVYNSVTYQSNEVRISVPFFTEQTGITLTGVEYSSVAWGDYDNDGDQDLLLTGYSNTLGYISRIYNNNAGVFTDINAGLTGVYTGSIAWGDYDNDGDLDVLLTGNTGSANISKIYRNDSGVFTDINAGLTGVNYSSVAWGDYDNDGDLDMLFVGSTGSGNISIIYRNDSGVFTNINAGLPGVYFGSVAWGDYDNDGDLDILLTGSGYSRIYRNDNNIFTDISAGLTGVSNSSSAWGDYDNDGDLDILVTGGNLSKIYRNDSGIFNDISAGLTGVISGSSAWGDFDNDGDLDILLTGNSGAGYVSKVYRNDGGVFTDLNTGLTGVGEKSSVAWGDYDNDGDLDILLTGCTASGYISKIYKNNTTVPNTAPLAPSNLLVSFGSNKVTLAWNKSTDTQTSQNGLSYNIYIGTSAGISDKRSPMATIPGGYRRITQTGSVQNNSWFIKGISAATYYWSVQAIDKSYAGSAFATEGSFTVPFSSSIAPITDQALATNQSSAVLTVTESSTPASRQWKYSTINGGPYNQSITGATATTCSPSFSNTGIYYVVCESVKGGIAYTSNQVKITVADFAEQTGTGLPGIQYSSVAWGDYDNDGDLDLLVTGRISSPPYYISRVYRNDAGVFTDINAGLTGVYYGSVAWGDYDNDGDLDILLTGFSTSYISVIYRNDNGVFNDISAGLPGVQYGSVAWGDYDNDGDLDVLLTGMTSTSYISKIYRNDAGVFTDINVGLPGVYYSSAAWGDYDKDGDLDILLTGSNGQGYISNIYRNDNGVFIDINAGLPGVQYGSAGWGDYDNDGDPDILLTGYSSNGYISKIYRNDAGVFTDINAGLIGVMYSSVAWGDYDNDGDLDILLTGNSSGSGAISKIYRNDSGIFTDINAGLTGIYRGSITWGDYDNDNDLDILLTGYPNYSLKVLKNLTSTSNSAPAAPSNLLPAVTGSGVTLTWDKSTDTKTPQNGLSYNIYIGTASGTINKRSPMAALPGGFRRIVQSGNIQGNSWIIKRLPAGNYYWSVQAIDNSFAGSAFATQGSFTVAFSHSIAPADDQILKINQSSAILTVAESSTATSRQWKYSTTSGGPYNQIITGATGITCSPSFSALGVYYVICESVKGSIAYTSNQVKIIVTDFLPQTGISLPGIQYGSAAWGDFDNDGDLDLLLTGNSVPDGYISRIYRNDLGVFNDISAGLTGVYQSSVAWGDYDNDGDLDILLTGNSSSGNISKIYNNNAGVFTDINAGLTGISGSSVAWGDYDNDGDLDILLTGNSAGVAVSKIYRNDNGTFKDINAGLIGEQGSSVAWGDYDNDGDPDILMTGSGGSFVYRNDNGIFTNIVAGLQSVSSGAAAWGDYDSDGDLDILISGSGMTKIYDNNNGVFSEHSTSFPVIVNSSAAWGDYDNDGDLDILLTGNSTKGVISKIFLNNNGTFAEVFAYLDGVYTSSTACGDYDNDGDLDILLCGTGYSGFITRIYKNNLLNQNAVPSAPSNLLASFSGNKTILTWDKSTDSKTSQSGLSYNLYIGTSAGSVNRKTSMAALPGGYRRIVQSGNQPNSWYIKNLTAGKYYWSVQAIDNSFAGSPFAAESSFTVPYSNSISPVTSQALIINQNGAALTVTESATPSSRQWKYSTVSGGAYNQIISGATATTYTPNFSAWGIYFVVCESTKDGTVYTSNEVRIDVSLFSEQTGISLTGVQSSSATWGDYDNDGDQDILVSGNASTGNISKVYRNDNGVFTDINAGLVGVVNGSVAWGDYDNDGDLDILLTGINNSKIYRNDNGIFTDLNAGLTGVSNSSVAWGDYDNDGDLDILLTGNGYSKIYRNDNGIFTDINAGLTGVNYSSVAWADYDTDGDLDILLTGSTAGGDLISKIYRNDNCAFTDINAGLTGVQYGSVAWGDFDSDGDPDILLTGYSKGAIYISKIYRNDNGIFPEVNAGLPGIFYGSVAWGDYDNDGDLDILLTGRTATAYISGIYRNDAGVFTDINAGLPASYQGSVSWGDYDKDNDLDILFTGYSLTSMYNSIIYKNNITTANAVPSTPSGLTPTVTGKGISLAWNKSTDSKTPQAGLSYNLYIGTTSATVNKKSPMSSLTDGYRRISQKGVIQKNVWLAKALPVGTYYWSVQATDNTFAGSTFATEGSFTVLFTNSIGPSTDQILAVNQSGTPLTVTESITPTSRQWKYSSVSGGPYLTITGATGTSWTPNFPDFGTYYIICESLSGSVTYTSNEVKIRVPIFSELTGINLSATSFGAAVWGDFDSDGDKDLLLTGNGYAKIYSNNSGLFSDINAGLAGAGSSSAAWGDYDNDNDLDVIISGYNSTTQLPITKIYRNDAGVFTDINAGLPGTTNGSVSWGDYDNDGDLDILLAGNNFTKIYRNDAGVFTDLNATLTGVTMCSAAWGDYDNDGDLDILLIGLAGADQISKIYRNDNGAFTDINAGLQGVQSGSVAWGDYDSDGDLDILLTGSGPGSVPVSLIYKNDAGVFTDINAGLPGIYNSSVSWGDYDNDGDLDIFFSGYYSYDGYSRIYRNDNGVFINIDDGIPGVQQSSAGWCDYDNDGDLDLVVYGSSSSGNIAKIYRNNALSANVVPTVPANLQASLAANKVTFSWNKSTDSKTSQNGLTYNLYVGTSAGSVSRKTPMAALPGGYRKIVQRGIQTSSWPIRNLAAGTYYWSVQAIDNSFAGSAFATEGSFTVAYSNSIAPAADQNLAIGQTGNQLTVTESSAATSRQWKYSTVSGGPYNQTITGATGTTYTPSFTTAGSYYVVCVSTKDAVAYTSNEVKINALTFIEQTGISLPGIRMGSVSWCDYDNDGDLDLLLSGYTTSGGVTNIYRNDGGTFTNINAGLTGAYQNTAAWGDYDNDGNMDLLLTGYLGSNNFFSKIYHNSSGVFSEINAGLPGVNFGSNSWCDYDNDGDLDILLTGNTGVNSLISRIYRNDNGVFTDINAGLTGIQNGAAAWGDYDNDGDMDLILTGYYYIFGSTSTTTAYLSKIYRNDNGAFIDINAGLTGVGYSSVVWGDYDNDGDLDILLAGSFVATGSTTTTYISKVYRNDSGVFTDISAGLKGVNYSSVAWGDYDNDGDLDILLTGNSGAGYISLVYRNDNGVFTDLNAGLSGLYQSSAAWGDYDNDGDLDLVLCGMDVSSNYYSKIYKNYTSLTNTVPAGPTSLLATAVSADKVTLAWNKAIDSQTPQNALTYNIRLGTTTGGINKIGPMASTGNGFRRIPARGNAEFKNSGYTVGNLTTGNYYWSVQAIDQAFAGGAWAAECTFTILAAPVATAATSITQTTMTANWGASTGATGYSLDVSTDGSFASFVTGYNNKDVGNLSSAVVTGLTANTTYYFRVRAYNSGGSSIVNSNMISATTLVEVPPIPTANAATSITQTGFTANWTSSYTPLGYYLDIATDNTFTAFLGGYNNMDVGNVTSYVITGLTARTIYYYRVRAYNVSGTSINSNTIAVTTWPNLPAPPSGLTAISCSDQVTLTWSANTEPDFLTYRIYGGASTNPTVKIDSTITGSISTTTKTLSGFTHGQTYYFRIKAVLSPGVASPFSTEVTVIVKKGVVPKIKSKWNDVLICYNLGDSLTSFQWYKGTTALSGATKQYYVTNKQAGSYTVLAADKQGCNNSSNIINITGTKSISVFPNPAENSFTINFNSETLGRAMITLINSNGEKVLEYQREKLKEELKCEIPVNNLPDGIYTIEVLVNDELSYSRVIVIN
jgi:hypothetical protein